MARDIIGYVTDKRLPSLKYPRRLHYAGTIDVISPHRDVGYSYQQPALIQVAGTSTWSVTAQVKVKMSSCYCLSPNIKQPNCVELWIEIFVVPETKRRAILVL